VPAITRAIDTDNGVRIDNITQLELQAVGFEELRLRRHKYVALLPRIRRRKLGDG
jgi:hypothetical protein